MSEKEFRWDAELYQGSSAVQYKLGIMTIERLKPLDKEKILEIGPGNAMLTIEIAKRIPNGTITAIPSLVPLNSLPIFTTPPLGAMLFSTLGFLSGPAGESRMQT